MAKKTPKGKTVEKTLLIPLTLEEIDERAQLASKTNQELLDLEESFKEVRSAHTAEVKNLRGIINRSLKAIGDKKEERTVKATMVRNFDDDCVEYWYKDEMIEKRDMQPADRQEELPLKQANAKRGRKALEAVPNDDQGVLAVIKDETNKKTKRTPLDRIDA